ncbi:MAG: hypothetical protein ACTSR2_07000 [Candidatus Hodarchaeales archaeon]
MISDLYYFGVDIKLNRVTENYDNLTGERQTTYGEDEYIKARYFEANSQTRLVKSGIVRIGEYVLYTDSTNELKKGDKITIRGEEFLVTDIPMRKGINDDLVYDVCKINKSSQQ